MDQPLVKPDFNPPPVASTLNAVQARAAASEHLPRALSLSLTAALSAGTASLDLLHSYANDDQYGFNGRNWKGRKPADGSEAEFLTMLVRNDQIGPAMRREVEAQFAKAPEWDASQNGTKLDPSSDLVKAMTQWHEDAGLTAAAKDAARIYWWSGQMVGRVYVPSEYAEDLLKNPPKTLEEALELIHVQAVDPRHGGPLTDQHGRTLGYWYRYVSADDQGKDVQLVEVHTPEKVFTFRSEDGKLTLTDDPADNPYAGTGQGKRRANYLMWHADREGGSSITPTVMDHQDRLGVTTTYMGRNDDQTGYRQIIVSNAEQFVDEEGRPMPFPMGPGVAVALMGTLKYSEHDISTQQDVIPSMERHEPKWQVIDPLNPQDYHVPSIVAWKTSILERLDQLWTLSPESQVSGESKRQSRKPFDRRASFAGQDMGLFLAWALRSALVLASQMIGSREHEGMTFIPKVFLDVDAANLEELRVKLNMWQAGALTLTTLLEATPGVGDAAKEAKDVMEGEGQNPVEKAKQDALARLSGKQPEKQAGES